MADEDCVAWLTNEEAVEGGQTGWRGDPEALARTRLAQGRKQYIKYTDTHGKRLTGECKERREHRESKRATLGGSFAGLKKTRLFKSLV